jgi:tripartite-type tricarboxylate transporter receptor subunit TctC
MNMRLLRSLAIIAFASLAFFVHAPSAQTPRTIKVVISVPPGGTIDYLVRLLADQIGKTNGQTVIIESRPGAGGVIAADVVAHAQPDGNTLLIMANGMIINSILRKVNYDPIKSYEPVCDLVSSPQVLVVNKDSPYRNLADFVAAARARPGQLSLASVGPHTTQHIAIERLKKLAGIDVIYVPFAGGAPAINALLGKHVDAVLQNYSETGEQMRAGTLRALATAAAKRIEAVPDLPTIAESGFPEFETDVWFGLVAPAKTPDAVMAQLIDWFRAALLAPAVTAKLATQALYPNPICGGDFATHIRTQSEEYSRLIRDLNIKIE